MNKIAVVILNWNGKSLLEKFIPSVILYSKEASIYVVDNASTDDSIPYLSKNYPEISIIQHEENYGFAKGYNKAIAHIKEPLLCMLNSDVEVTENWLHPILLQFERETNTAAIQPKIKQYYKKEYFEYSGAAGGFIDAYGFPFCQGRIFDTLEIDNAQYDYDRTIFWASGACFFVRKSIFENFGGFDELFFAHMEEIDFCWRIFNQHWDIKYNFKSTVYHVGGATLHESNPKKTYLNYRNSLLMLYKNLPKQKRFSIIFQRLCLDGISGIRLMFQFRPKHCFAIIRSHFAFYNMVSLYKSINLDKRPDYYETTSIIWKYFVQKKRIFRDFNAK